MPGVLARGLVLGAIFIGAPGAPLAMPPQRGAPPLPPVPRVDGPLAIKVVYPGSNQEIASRDSNFIFGAIGTGRGTLRINGADVRVLPNGSFLAFLPIPSRERPSYDLVAVRGRDTARAVHPVRILAPRPVLAATGALVVDSGSVSPTSPAMLPRDELVRVSVRAPSNASVVAVYAGGRASLVNGAVLPRFSLDSSRASDPADVARYLGDPLRWATDLPANTLRDGATLIISRGRDTVRLPVRPIEVIDPATAPLVGLLGGGPATPSDSDRFVIARPLPAGTYKWVLMPGVFAEITGRQGDFVRIKLDDQLDAWVLSGDIRPLPRGAALPRRTASNARVVPARDWVDVIVPMTERPAHLAEVHGDRLSVTLYDTYNGIDIVQHVANDPLVRRVSATPETRDRVRLDVQLSAQVFGYLVFWDQGNLVIRVRRPPAVDARLPLRGLTVAIDAGHPPVGATGPTGLYEGDAVLEITQRLRALLTQRGARVVMTRTTRDPVALADRPVLARQANVHVFVSVHLNALPDGINPFTAHGTSTYFYHPQSEPLARDLQYALVASMGLRNLGVFYNTFAVTRGTWYPSALAEGAFIMIPEQEAALRTPEFQARYAQGIVTGLEVFFTRVRAGR